MKKLNDFSLKSISDLEEEIKDKKKLLKKAKEEQKAKLIQKPEINEEEGMKLIPFDIVKYKFCPNCSAKLKKTKAKKNGLNLSQSFTCRQCGFHKEINLRV